MQACFRQLNAKLDIDAFDSRLVAQKVVYLLEELGVKLGYKGTYGFHIRGTYSPTLTKDLYQSKAEGLLMADPPALSHAEEQKVQRLKAVVDLRPYQLEVVAAYRYLTHEKGLPPDAALRELKTRKPHLPEREVALGVSKCKQLFPQATARDVDDLHAEMAAWDAAANRDHL